MSGPVHLHDVRLVHGGNTLPAAALSVVERITRNTLGRLPSDELDGLHNTIDNLYTKA